MRLELGKNRDFWAGVMLIGTGAAALFIARDYRFGSMLKMGPGFFPSVLSGVLIAFGVYIMAMGLRSKEKIRGRLALRPLIMLSLSLVLFGELMQYAGFIPAMIALVFVSAASIREFRFVEVLLVALVLTVTAAALFIWGLGMPYPLIKGF